MPNLNGYKTAVGMVLVILGQVCHLLGGKWPILVGLGTVLIDTGSGVGVIGLTHKAVKATRVPE